MVTVLVVISADLPIIAVGSDHQDGGENDGCAGSYNDCVVIVMVEVMVVIAV